MHGWKKGLNIESTQSYLVSEYFLMIYLSEDGREYLHHFKGSLACFFFLFQILMFRVYYSKERTSIAKEILSMGLVTVVALMALEINFVPLELFPFIFSVSH